MDLINYFDMYEKNIIPDSAEIPYPSYFILTQLVQPDEIFYFGKRQCTISKRPLVTTCDGLLQWKYFLRYKNYYNDNVYKFLMYFNKQKRYYGWREFLLGVKTLYNIYETYHNTKVKNIIEIMMNVPGAFRCTRYAKHGSPTIYCFCVTTNIPIEKLNLTVDQEIISQSKFGKILYGKYIPIYAD